MILINFYFITLQNFPNPGLSDSVCLVQEQNILSTSLKKNQITSAHTHGVSLLCDEANQG